MKSLATAMLCRLLSSYYVASSLATIPIAKFHPSGSATPIPLAGYPHFGLGMFVRERHALIHVLEFDAGNFRLRGATPVAPTEELHKFGR